MEAGNTSETQVNSYKTTQLNISEDVYSYSQPYLKSQLQNTVSEDSININWLQRKLILLMNVF
jgi:hypothetical protein